MKNTTPWAVRGFTRLLCAFMALVIGLGPMSASHAQAVDPVARGLAAKANTSAGISAAGGALRSVQKVARAAKAAEVGNLYDNAEYAGGTYTVTDAGTLPGGYTKTFNGFAGANVNFTVRGGRPVVTSSTRMGVRATSDLSGNGNIGTATPELSRASAIEFNTDASSVLIRVQRQTSKGYRIAINNRYVSKTLQAWGTADAFTNYITITGLTGMNKIRMESDDSVIWTLVGVAPTKSIYPVTDELVRAMFVSDSYGTAFGGTFGHLGYGPIAAARLGWNDPWMLAVSGTGYTSGSPTNFPASDTRRLADLIPGDGNPVDVVVLALGGNDASGVTVAQARDTIAAIRLQCPKAIIFVMGPWAFTSGPSAAVLTREANISAAVTAINDPLIKFLPMNADPAGIWLYGTTNVSAPGANDNTGVYLTSDSTHPNDAGYAYIASRLVAAVRAAITSMTAVAANDSAGAVPDHRLMAANTSIRQTAADKTWSETLADWKAKGWIKAEEKELAAAE